jgi:DNA mismatch repair ATPase MutS
MSSVVMGIIAVTLVIFITTSLMDIRKATKKRLKRIHQSWGKNPRETYKHEDLESIASYFVNHRKKHPSSYAIDDITYRDLDMDDLFIHLNSVESTAGEETLYKLLREPLFDLDILKARQKLIRFFQMNQAERVAIQIILAKLGKKRLINVTDYFFNDVPSQPWKVMTYRLLAAIALLSPLMLFVNTGMGALLIVLSLIANIFVYYSRRFDIAADLAALGYIVRLVQCVGRLINTDLKAPDLEGFKSGLQSHYERISYIGKRRFYLFLTSSGSFLDVVIEYIKIVLLKELIDYEYLCNAVLKHQNELIQVYDAVGLLDSLIAIASFRESTSFYCEPDLKIHNSYSAKHLEFEEIYHPLISNPIANSLAVDRSVLITGSNASGKSTFLKIVAINAILAQSFYTCLARKYSSSMFAIFTSMALRDSMKNGESYFIAEIKSIKRIMDYVNVDTPCLCLIDEVLRGTNTIERIAASSQVLLQLAKQNCLCIAATHDIELTFILEGAYRNVHFQEAITKDGIVFDYKLRDGGATSRNAIKLLQLIGYDAEIVEQAEKRADGFVSRGSWKETSSQ